MVAPHCHRLPAAGNHTPPATVHSVSPAVSDTFYWPVWIPGGETAGSVQCGGCVVCAGLERILLRKLGCQVPSAAGSSGTAASLPATNTTSLMYWRTNCNPTYSSACTAYLVSSGAEACNDGSGLNRDHHNKKMIPT